MTRKLDSYFVLFTSSLENPEFVQFKGKVGICTIESQARRFVAVRDGDQINYNGDFSEASLNDFVKDNELSYLPELSQETYGTLAAKNISTLVVDLNNAEHMEIVKKYKEFAKGAAAQAWAKYFNLAFIDGNHWEKYIETFKPHTKADYPFFLIINPTDDKKYWSRLIGTADPIQTVGTLLNEISGEIEKPKNKDEL